MLDIVAAMPLAFDLQWLAHPPLAGHSVSEQCILANSMKGFSSTRPTLKVVLICNSCYLDR